LVEWGDMAAPALGESVLEVVIEIPDVAGSPGRRLVLLTGRGRWAGLADEVGDALGPPIGASGWPAAARRRAGT
ncbi:MAG TPA: hypothetical protein VEG62_09350, partial [Acidimicrobiales bacterium]|nr:hypothetical protein [Acidimicrobiales bacterium]